MRFAPSFQRSQMAATLNFDVLIIGGGQAGPPLARALAKAGKTVALAERKYLGDRASTSDARPPRPLSHPPEWRTSPAEGSTLACESRKWRLISPPSSAAPMKSRLN